jgi:hypothetical protein
MKQGFCLGTTRSKFNSLKKDGFRFLRNEIMNSAINGFLFKPKKEEGN